MAEYLQAEILNEVARIFSGRVSSSKTGGIPDVQDVHSQMKSMVIFTMLTFPDSIFYVSNLASNRLHQLVEREVALVESMLVSLEELGHMGTAVRNTTALSDASTALLALDASSSVKNRPELNVFSRSMDRMLGRLYNNAVSNNALTRPREEAREHLRSDLANLKSVHASVLEGVANLRDLLDDYNDLDIASLAATSAMSNIRSNLSELSDNLSELGDSENIAISRMAALRVMASKAAVRIISEFGDPSEPLYRGPSNPLPTNIGYTGYLTGSGTPASVPTEPGPWLRSSLQDDMTFEVNGGSPQTIDLRELNTAYLVGRAEGDFEATAGAQNLFVVADPTFHKFEAESGCTTTVIEMPSGKRLNWVHRGAVVLFPDALTSPGDTDTRVITELENVGNSTQTTWDSATNVVTMDAASSTGRLPSSSDDVGFYVSDDSGQKFEITEYVSTVGDIHSFRVDPRGLTVDAGAAKTVTFFAGDGSFTVSPALTTAPSSGDRVWILPPVKAGQLTIGTRTVAQAVSDLSTNTLGSWGTLTGLDGFFRVKEAPGSEGHIMIAPRTWKDPFVQVTSVMLDVKTPSADETLSASAHKLLGFRDGELDTVDTVTVQELVDYINSSVSGVRAERNTRSVLSGSGASVAYGTSVVTVQEDAEVLGVEQGHQLRLSGGSYSGLYRVDSVSGSDITVDAAFDSSETDLRYEVTEETAVITSNNNSLGSALLVQGPSSVLNMSSTVRGSIPYFKAVDKLGNLQDFSNVQPGHLLKVTGQPEVEILSNSNGVLELASGLPANLSKLSFVVRSGSYALYAELSNKMENFLTTRSLLGQHGFSSSLDSIDAALTFAVTPGQNFQSSRNRARNLLLDLLAALTSEPSRSSEYSGTLPTTAMDLMDVLSTYSIPEVPAFSSMLDSLEERKYDRAVSLLMEGRIKDFFDTDEETVSFSGNVMASGRKVVYDLPNPSLSEAALEADVALNMEIGEGTDPDWDLFDTETDETLEL